MALPSPSSSRPTHRRKHSSRSASIPIPLSTPVPHPKRTKLDPSAQPQQLRSEPPNPVTDKLGSSTMIKPAETSDPDPGWTTVGTGKMSKGKLKKQQRIAKHLENNPAEFHFDTRGFRHGRMVQIKDVRDLVLSIVADERNQEWMLVKNKSNITKTVVVMIPGITPETLGLTKPNPQAIMPFSIASRTSKLPILQSLFSHACPTKAGGDRLRMFSCMNAFLTVQLSAMAKVKREEDRKQSSKDSSSADPTTYLLSAELMAEQDYPTLNYDFPVSAADRQAARIKHPLGAPDDPPPRPAFEAWTVDAQPGYIQTPASADRALGRSLRVLGLDCEMCETASGRELTRCTVVDDRGGLVYDQLVRPEEPITNYLTRFSGMTAERLAGVSTRLADVQRALAGLIDFDTVLVGHSLDCDLRALKFAHPWVIDTSVIYQHPRGLPMKPSLKWLASKWLGKEIQAGLGEHGGHESEEDARTAVELLRKKMEKGLGFGEFAIDQESIFERMARTSESKRAAVVDFGSVEGRTNGSAGRSTWKNATSYTFGSDKEVVDGIISCLDEHDFVFGRLMELSHAIGWSTPQQPKGSTTELPPPTPAPPAELAQVYHDLDEQIGSLNDRLPRGTSLIIFTGHSDPRAMAALNAKKSKFERALKSSLVSAALENGPLEHRWMSEDERLLADEVEKCKVGMSFFRIK